MKLLGLLRHAKSDWDDMNLRDFDRGLNMRGQRGAALMGDHIRDHGIAWEHVLASPAQRVRMTLEAAGFTGPVEWQERAYLASSSTLIDLLRQIEGDPASVLLSGHNPGLQDLIFDLIVPGAENPLSDEAAEKLPTATYAVLELDTGAWSDLAPGCGTLVHFVRPRDLDSSLGPER